MSGQYLRSESIALCGLSSALRYVMPQNEQVRTLLYYEPDVCIFQAFSAGFAGIQLCLYYIGLTRRNV